MYDFDKLKKCIERCLTAEIEERAKELNLPSEYLSLMLSSIAIVFKSQPPETIKDSFSIIINNNFDIPSEAEEFCFNQISAIDVSGRRLCVLDTNRFVSLDNSNALDYKGNDFFEYCYLGKQNEHFKINDEIVKIQDYVDTIMYSIFSIPTFSKIDDALSTYYIENAKYSVCHDLRDAWEDSQTKQILKEKPEHYFRDSLWYFLRTYLRGYSVKREQVVDSSHPVDIKAIGPTLLTVSLIEVKWIGKSKKVSYYDARANEGAKQLIDYLNSSKIEEPDKIFKGYLTVFDVRRSKRGRNYYENKDINYSEEYKTDERLIFKRFFLCE